eukprot:COSAG01_NODE_17398_length_1154_cov_11.730247_1_plen_134_part_01
MGRSLSGGASVTAAAQEGAHTRLGELNLGGDPGVLRPDDGGAANGKQEPEGTPQDTTGLTGRAATSQQSKCPGFTIALGTGADAVACKCAAALGIPRSASSFSPQPASVCWERSAAPGNSERIERLRQWMQEWK